MAKSKLCKTMSAAELARREKDELVKLIVELCKHFEDVRAFVQSRFHREASVDWYKKQVQCCVRPDVIEGNEFDFERGVALVEQYKSATDDVQGTIDLMLYFVEQGNQFTLDCGDIDSWFYEEMEEMFAKAVQIMERDPKQLTNEVEARIRKICDETNGIGWGYHDTLCDLAARVVPDE